MLQRQQGCGAIADLAGSLEKHRDQVPAVARGEHAVHCLDQVSPGLRTAFQLVKEPCAGQHTFRVTAKAGQEFQLLRSKGGVDGADERDDGRVSCFRN